MTNFPTCISRERALILGQETVRILDAGGYILADGHRVDIRQAIDQSVQDTRTYPPETAFLKSQPGNYSTHFEVRNETTLYASHRLLESGFHPVALNFASATSPGGGFLSGARAQEEYLCRSSGLYACLRDQPMYAFHRRRNDPLYTSYMLYSPDVPVIRDDDHRLLPTPYPISIITAAAPMAKHLGPDRQAEIEQAFRERIAKVLWIGLESGHTAIVIGAWGCGAFGNDGIMVSQLFREALLQDFAGAYQRVLFAIIDWSEDKQFIGPFETAFV